MCDRAKYLISDMKNKIEVELQVCNAEISQLAEELKAERTMKQFPKSNCQVQMPAVMFAVVFVAVFMAKYFII